MTAQHRLNVRLLQTKGKSFDQLEKTEKGYLTNSTTCSATPESACHMQVADTFVATATSMATGKQPFGSVNDLV